MKKLFTKRLLVCMAAAFVVTMAVLFVLQMILTKSVWRERMQRELFRSASVRRFWKRLWQVRRSIRLDRILP